MLCNVNYFTKHPTNDKPLIGSIDCNNIVDFVIFAKVSCYLVSLLLVFLNGGDVLGVGI